MTLYRLIAKGASGGHGRLSRKSSHGAVITVVIKLTKGINEPLRQRTDLPCRGRPLHPGGAGGRVCLCTQRSGDQGGTLLSDGKYNILLLLLKVVLAGHRAAPRQEQEVGGGQTVARQVRHLNRGCASIQQYSASLFITNVREPLLVLEKNWLLIFHLTLIETKIPKIQEIPHWRQFT